MSDCSPPGFSVHGDSPGKNTGVGCHFLLQGIFPTQESNPGLPHCRQILYSVSHQGIPRTLEWVAYPFSRGSSHPRDQTQVSHIAGRFFTVWATEESQEHWSGWLIPSPGDLPNTGIQLGSPALQVDFWPTELPGKPGLQNREKHKKESPGLPLRLGGKEFAGQCGRHGFHPTCHRATKPSLTTPEPRSHNCWSLHAREPVLCNKRSPQSEKPSHSN